MTGGPYNYKAMDFAYANTVLVAQNSQSIEPWFEGRITVPLVGSRSDRSDVSPYIIDVQGWSLVTGHSLPSTHLYACGVTGDVFIAAPGNPIRRVDRTDGIWTGALFRDAPPYSNMDRDRFINLPHIHRHAGNPAEINPQPDRFNGMPIVAFAHPMLYIAVLSVDRSTARLYVRNNTSSRRTVDYRVYFEPNLVEMPGYGVRLRSPSNRIIFDSSCYYMDVIDVQGVGEWSNVPVSPGTYYVQCAPPLIEDAYRTYRKSRGLNYRYNARVTRNIYLYFHHYWRVGLTKVQLEDDTLFYRTSANVIIAWTVGIFGHTVSPFTQPLVWALKGLNVGSSVSWPKGERINEGQVAIMRIRDNAPGRT